MGRALVVWRAGVITAGLTTSAATPPTTGEAMLSVNAIPPRPKDRRRNRRLAKGLGVGRVVDLEA